MRILVLGGTAWVGRTTAEVARDRGDDVICLARGSSGSTPRGVTFVRGDRSTAGGYRALRGEFDRVVDVTRHPGHVRTAVGALRDRVGRYVLVSTGNVYADHSQPGGTEDTPLLDPLDSDEMTSIEVYGEAKVACERAVAEAYPRHTLARSGLIGGPGDAGGRTAYWPWRFAHPADPDGRVLVPEADRAAQQVDVRDLVDFCLTTEGDGAFDVVGNRGRLRESLQAARDVAGHAGETVAVSEDWLHAHDVTPWSGPRSLPLWADFERWEGFADRSNARAKDAGLRVRPLAETLRDSLYWTEAHRAAWAPTWDAGLTDDDERSLLAAATGGC